MKQWKVGDSEGAVALLEWGSRYTSAGWGVKGCGGGMVVHEAKRCLSC